MNSLVAQVKQKTESVNESQVESMERSKEVKCPRYERIEPSKDPRDRMGQGQCFKKEMAKFFPELMKHSNPQSHEVQ